MIAGIEKLLQVRRHEWRLLGSFFVLNLLLYAGIFAGRGIRDALFFSNLGAQYLPYIFIINALTLTIVSTLLSRWTSSTFSKRRLLYGSFIFCLITITAFGFLMNVLPKEVKWQYFIFYFITEIPIFLSLTLIWVLAEDYFTVRMGERLFPHIIGGGHIGIVLGGSIILFLPKYFGTHNLIFFWSLFVLGQILLVSLIFGSKFVSRVSETKEEEEEQEKEVRVSFLQSLQENLQVVKKYKYLITFVLITGCNFFLMAAFDFRLNQSANELFPGNPNKLANMLGFFTVGFGVVSVLIQFSLINRLIQKLTVPKVNLFAPSLLALGSFILFLFTTNMMGPVVQPLRIALHAFYFVAIARFVGYVAEYLFNQTLIQFIYGAVPSEDRNSARFFVEGSFTNIVVGATGFFLVGYNTVFKIQTDLLTLICLVAGILMVWASVKLMRQYKDILTRGFPKFWEIRDIFQRNPKLLDDPEATKGIIESLKSPEPIVVRSTIDLISKYPKPKFVEEIERLVTHESIEVRTKAIDAIVKFNLPDSFQRVLNNVINFETDPGGVRRVSSLKFHDSKTLRSLFSGLGKVRHNLDLVSTFSRLLEDNSPAVVGETVLLLARSGMGGVYASVGALKKLLDSFDEYERRIGFEIIGELGTDSFGQAISNFLARSNSLEDRHLIEMLGNIEFQKKKLLVDVFENLLSKYNQSSQKRFLNETISTYIEKYPFLGLPLWGRLFRYKTLETNNYLSRNIPRFMRKMVFSGEPEIISEFLSHYTSDRNEVLFRELLDGLGEMFSDNESCVKEVVDRQELLQHVTPNLFFTHLLGQSERDTGQRLALIDILHFRIKQEIEPNYHVDMNEFKELFNELLKKLYILSAMHATVEERTLGSRLAATYEPFLRLVQKQMRNIQVGLFQVIGCMYPEARLSLSDFAFKVSHPDRFVRDDAMTKLEQMLPKDMFDALARYFSIQDFAPYQDKALYRKNLQELYDIVLSNLDDVSEIVSETKDPFIIDLFKNLENKSDTI